MIDDFQGIFIDIQDKVALPALPPFHCKHQNGCNCRLQHQAGQRPDSRLRKCGFWLCVCEFYPEQDQTHRLFFLKCNQYSVHNNQSGYPAIFFLSSDSNIFMETKKKPFIKMLPVCGRKRAPSHPKGYRQEWKKWWIYLPIICSLCNPSTLIQCN